MKTILKSLTFSVVLLIPVVILAKAQLATTESSPAKVVIQLASDRGGVATLDGRSTVTVSPGNTVELAVPSGLYSLRAVSNVGGHYWEKVLAVDAPGPVVVRIQFSSSLAGERDDELAVEALKRRIEEHHREAEHIRENISSLRRASDRLRQPTEVQRAEAVRWLRATVAEIERLDQQFQLYTKTAAELSSKANEVKRQADTQNTATTLGALSGLLGNLGATSISNDSWRYRLRARGALVRMNRLSGFLSDASDTAFERRPSPTTPTTFQVERKGFTGQLTVVDGRIDYRESIVSSNTKPSAPVTLTLPCAANWSIKGTGLYLFRDLNEAPGTSSELTLKSEKQSVKFTPVSATSGDLLSEVFLACPDRDF